MVKKGEVRVGLLAAVSISARDPSLLYFIPVFAYLATTAH